MCESIINDSVHFQRKRAMHYHDAIIQSIKSLGYAIGAAGSAIGTFMIHSLPFLQFCLVIVGIISGYYSIRASRATHDAIKRGSKQP